MKTKVIILAATTFLLANCERSNQIENAAVMTDEELLDQVSDIAFEKLAAADDRMERVPEPYQTVVIVYSAQGIIDNGGLQYFFENDWPNNPPYSIFSDAYERIGRIEAAVALREASRTFGVERPELDVDLRRAFIEKNYDEDDFEVKGWNDCICGDEEVWIDLATWVRKQAEFSDKTRKSNNMTTPRKPSD